MAAGSSSGGGGGVPPGFRFHPTDEELLHFYLKKKVSFQKFDMEVIREVDLNKIEPWDLQERCKIGSTPQNEWYFFSHKDRKYPTGSRTNRATSAGFWKATGRDKCIRNSFKKIGMRKTLVFYRGRAPHGQKTDWIMHEYRLEEADSDPHSTEDGWVVCRVFKKKNLFKVGNNSGEGGGGHHHGSNMNNGSGLMMMMNGCDDVAQLNMMSNTTTSAATTSHQSQSLFTQLRNNSNNNLYLMHHPHGGHADLSYSHQIPPSSVHTQYPPQQSFISSDHIKPLMLNSSNSYDHNHHHQNSLSAFPTVPTTTEYEDHHHHHQSMQVKQFMSRDDCETTSAASPTAAGAAANYHQQQQQQQACEAAGLEECDQASSQTLQVTADDHTHQGLNEWDRLAVITTSSHHHHHQDAADPASINHQALRSEMDFWAYGK